jgi:hypothetical protein
MHMGKTMGSEKISDTLARIYYVVDYFRRTTLGLSQIPLENNVGFITDARCPSHISHVFGFDSTARRLEQ